jgi:hypothetical protein
MAANKRDAREAPERYLAWTGSELVQPGGLRPAGELASHVHKQVRERILANGFPCLGARSAFKRRTYRFGCYGPLASGGASEALADDLCRFVAEQGTLPGLFTSFIASFDSPEAIDEQCFETLLWRQLQMIHDLDLSTWDPSVSADSQDPHFSFSFGGMAFYVVGMHAASSRLARRLAWPSLIFNPHHQFEQLRRVGQYDRLKAVIRVRDLHLQGSINPNTIDHGVASEAMQYSGRARSTLAHRCRWCLAKQAEEGSRGARPDQGGGFSCASATRWT